MINATAPRACREDRASECGETPFLLAARGNRSVFLRVWGDELPLGAAPAPAPAPGAAPEPPACPTANRVLVYHARSARLLRAVCPRAGAAARAVQLFSEDWAGAGAGGGGALLLVWAAREAGAARFAWMEVWRPAGGGAAAAAAAGPNATARCARGCAALGACMPAALWCDGARDCPGGADEAAGAGCGAAARLLAALRAPAAAGAAAALGGAAALGALAAAAWRRRRAGKAAPGGRRATAELLFDSRASSAAS